MAFSMDFMSGFIVLAFFVHGGSGCSPDDGVPGSDGTYGIAPHGGDGVIPPLEERTPSRTVREVQHRSIPAYVRRLSPGYLFSVMDDNKDGNIDAIEWMQAGMTSDVRAFVHLLDQIDEDNDNMVSLKEFNEWYIIWTSGKLDMEEVLKGADETNTGNN